MDWHLNFFYSYNQDNELIENNLTRAFIVTLRFLSPNARHFLLDGLLNPRLKLLGSEGLSFHAAQVALQSHINLDRVRQTDQRYLLALASDRIEMVEEDDIQGRVEKLYTSIPDGWIYDYHNGWCILIESKVGSNPIDDIQLTSHAATQLGIDAFHLVNHLISLSWADVITASLQLEDKSEVIGITQQEKLLLSEFRDFLGFYGYRKFDGLSWLGLQVPPRFMLRKHSTGRYKRKGFLQLSDLQPAPNFRIPSSPSG